MAARPRVIKTNHFNDVASLNRSTSLMKRVKSYPWIPILPLVIIPTLVLAHAKVRGKVAKIQADTGQVTLTTADGRDLVFYLDERRQPVQNEHPVRLKDLHVGDEVTVVYELRRVGSVIASSQGEGRTTTSSSSS